VEVPLSVLVVTGCVCFGSLEHAAASSSIMISKKSFTSLLMKFTSAEQQLGRSDYSSLCLEVKQISTQV
jgi:hypothetical protein